MNATVDRDVPYGRRPAQRLDIHRPPGATGCPVLVLVHGGAWAVGDKANPEFIDRKAAHFTGAGWVVVSVNYRLLPWGGPKEQAEDVAKALATVQAHIGRWGGDAARVCVLGHSTGAHLSALVLADSALGAPFGLRPVQGAVLLDSAALDVVRVMEGAHLPLHERAFGTKAAAWPALSPWHRLQTAPPPLLLVCSAQRADAQAQSQRFADKAVSLGGQARVLALDLGHAEINRELGAPGVFTEAVDAFLSSCVAQGKPRSSTIPHDF